MINDLINEKNKISYLKCINDIAAELAQITCKINGKVNSVIECAKNNVKIVHDAKRTTKEILGILESTQENFTLVRFNFIHSYHLWLKDVSSDGPRKTNGTEPNLTCNLDTNQNETVVDLEDSDDSEIEIIQEPGIPDVQIVNQVSYPSRPQACSSNGNLPRDKQSDDLSLSQPNTSNETSHVVRSDLVHGNHDVSFMDISFEAVAHIEQFDIKKTHLGATILDSNGQDQVQTNTSYQCIAKYNLNETELSSDSQDHVISKQIQEIDHVPLTTWGTKPSKSSSNQDYLVLKQQQIHEITDVPLTNLRIKPSDYSDERLRLRCFVQLNSLDEQNLSTSISRKKKSQCTLEDDAFLRLIDLSALEKQTNKRRRSPFDGSCSSTSDTSSRSGIKSQVKRQKIYSDNSDVTSFYESSNSDTDDDLSYGNKNFEQSIFEKLDENEEKAKLLLLDDSDTSDDSDIPLDNDEDQFDVTRNKRNSAKTKSFDSKSPQKQKSSRSTWLNDELLRFKLPPDKNHEYIPPLSLQNVNDLECSNDIEIPEATGTTSLASTTSQEMSSHSRDQDHENHDDDNCIEPNIGIATPINKKVAGRRNIREVLDDQDITEITRQAVKDEEIRISRLAERKKQLNNLVRSEASLDKNSLTLDWDFKTNKKLVQVDRGLVKLLKAHQKEGVRFMWDCCFESVEQVRTQRGSGCILAHCMGLGKTLQVITLVHTLLSNEAIGIKTIMIVCPMNTILNWVEEFDTWLEQVDNKSNIKIVELTQVKGTSNRISQLENWQKNGGVLIISYDMLVSCTSFDKKISHVQLKKMNNLLINPGADLVVCDEGHLLKNEASKRANTMQSVGTQRRIILTGTPLQNNLNEYHCMVEFVKPHLLGSKAEFLNRFGNPITNGQFDNSTPHDVKLMKHRAHVLHRLLEGCVQRCDYAVLRPLLPPKQEYVISVRLSKLQTEMYQHFVGNVAQISKKQSCLFKNYQEIKRLVAHPKTMQLKMQRRKQLNNHDDDKAKRQTNSNSNEMDDWWRDFVKEEDLEDMSISYKLVLLFGLLECCAKKQDKVLVFSQCLLTLDLIELFLQKLDGQWTRGFDYFRLDGASNASERSKMCQEFNDPRNNRAKLFLISTRAGGLGINLTGANRVVVFDPSWNPSNDLQSIFRVFRFGQEKPCYIYRFLTAGTMEEKIYIRQVTKLSLSLRVLDEQQVGRHYRDTDLTDLYKLDHPLPEAPVLNRPKDDLLTEVLSKYDKYVYKFFEHDSLLENQEEEELNEEERNQAWFDYHQENQAQPNIDATIKPRTYRKKLSESSSVAESSTASDTAALPTDETVDLSD